jgi:hypothetical protein
MTVFQLALAGICFLLFFAAMIVRVIKTGCRKSEPLWAKLTMTPLMIVVLLAWGFWSELTVVRAYRDIEGQRPRISVPGVPEHWWRR